MKTLVETINEIKSAKMSKSAKREALIKLGIMAHEVSLIMSTLPSTPSAPRASFTFGVEIECYAHRNRIESEALATALKYRYEEYNHDTRNIFKFVPDGSLNSSDRLETPGIECVSPVLRGANGKKALKCACDTLNAANAVVDHTCGLHVHIGAKELTDEQYINVFVNYAHLESIIDTFMARSRRENNAYYARSLTNRLYPIETATTKQDVLSGLSYERYYKVNPCSYARHKTIEFRQHGGTTDFDKIFNWVNFCGKLVNWSKTHRLTAETAPRSIDEIEFLTTAEKKFFKSRVNALNGIAQAA